MSLADREVADIDSSKGAILFVVAKLRLWTGAYVWLAMTVAVLKEIRDFFKTADLCGTNSVS